MKDGLRPIGNWILVKHGGIATSSGSTVHVYEVLDVGELVLRVTKGDRIAAKRMEYYLLKANDDDPLSYCYVVHEDDVVGVVEAEEAE